MTTTVTTTVTTTTDVPELVLEPPSPEALAAGQAAAEALIYHTDWSMHGPDVPPASGRVVTVYSPKGGAGTTFVAVNLAVALAAEGHRVCLVDLDLQFGDVAIMTRTSPVRGVIDAVGVELTDAVLAGMVTSLTAGPGVSLDCVLAPVDPAAGDTVTADLVGRLLHELRRRYDHVVVDTAAQLSEHTLEALEAADQQVLVTTPEISSIKSTRLLLDTLDLIGAPADRRLVVVNQSDPKDRSATVSVAEALRHAVIVAVPRSAAVGTSADLGLPLVTGTPKDPAAVSLRAFAVQYVAPVPTAAPRRRFGRRQNRSEATS